MNLLMTADAVGGVWTYALDLARGLRNSGVSTLLVVPGPEPDPDQRAAAETAGVELLPIGGALDWTAASPDEVRETAGRIRAFVSERRPDLVHLNSAAFGAGGGFPAPVVVGCHSCLKTWWAAVKGPAPLPTDFQWRVGLAAEGCRAADALVAPSRAFAVATRSAYGLSAAPKVVWNGREGQPSVAEPDSAIPSGAFAFASGRLWDEAKGPATLDQAAARLDLPIYAAGPVLGPNGTAAELDHVTLLGRLSEDALAAWLAARPIFVSPSLYEPFGLSVLEAAQAGCPLVLSDIPTFRELWDGAAAFVPPRDAEAMADVLDTLAQDPQQRAQLGRAAENRAGRYTVQAMCAATLEIYRSVLARGALAGAAA